MPLKVLSSSYVRPVICLVLGVSALVVVSLIGHDQLRKGSADRSKSVDGVKARNSDRYSGEYTDDVDRTVSKLLLKNIHGENILNNLRHLSKKPHTAGTEENNRVAEWIRDQWTSQGLQDVHFAEYDVLLSYPADYDKPNTVELLDGGGQLIYRSVGQQPPLVPQEQSDHGANLTYNAYSASGTAVGELVYVNYATKNDFDLLEKQNISLKGKIAIARYGMQWRGGKAFEVQKRGAIGLIIYSDPAEVCPNITDDGGTYPHSVWMPKGGVQLGSLLDFEGDPLTPLYPAVDYMYRSKNIVELQQEGILPSIPVQPMSYGDAYQFLSRMKGQEAAASWQGGLNITYKIDQGAGTDLKVRLTVRANTTTSKIKNVIGFIEGRREPDRYVIVGNHFDAWIYGAIDPNSATATMLEMSRAFMRVINETGWRPLRTIVFCAWDGEEHSLHGSTEWIQQYTTLLDHRAVAYLNIDLISGNETLSVNGNPTLYETAVKAAQRVPNPNMQEKEAGRKTVFDTWVRRYPPKTIPGVPEIPSPSGGSDHVSFFSYSGVPVADIRYTNITIGHNAYPLYHTLYETMFVQEKLLDPNKFAFHVATGQFWAEMTRILAHSNLLPLNVEDYATVLKAQIRGLNETLAKTGLLPKTKELAKDMDSLKQALDNMADRAEKFHYFAEKFRHTNTPEMLMSSSLEMFNSRLQQVERCFLNPRGDPDHLAQRHVVYGIGTVDAYASTNLPFVYRQVEKYQEAKDEQERAKAYNGLREQISILHYSVDCVTSLLKKTPIRSF